MGDDISIWLLQQAREQSPEALAALCEHVYPKLVRYMHYRVGAAEADDLAAEVLVRVLRGISKQKGSFFPWLYRIAANVIADYARSATTRKEEPMTDSAAQLALARGSDHVAAAGRLDIENALAALSEDQREFVVLKFLQGLTNAEIGELTGRTPEAIRALQFRALRALRDLLGDSADE